MTNIQRILQQIILQVNVVCLLQGEAPMGYLPKLFNYRVEKCHHNNLLVIVVIVFVEKTQMHTHIYFPPFLYIGFCLPNLQRSACLET